MIKWLKKVWAELSPFTRATFIRALKTMAQVAAAMLMAHDRVSTVEWPYVFDTTLMSGLFSILTSAAAGLPESPLQNENAAEIKESVRAEVADFSVDETTSTNYGGNDNA